MADNQTNKNNSDEIDLGQLFRIIRKGLNKSFVGFLRIFLYLKKNIFILLGLIIVGVIAGYGLNQIVSKKLKTEVIVKPQTESKGYLYSVIDEIQANLKAKNFNFFKNIGFDTENLDYLEITIAPIDDDKESSDGEMKYLELLQSFENTDAISDIVRKELENKSTFHHKITILYREDEKGKALTKAVLEYINSNSYFDGILEVQRANAENRIKEDKTLLKQVDELIANYSKRMAKDGDTTGSERIVLDNQERINITGLFDLKKGLIRDIESKKIELRDRTEPIKIINTGKSQEVKIVFFSKSIVLIPSIFLGLFLIISVIRYLNIKANQIT